MKRIIRTALKVTLAAGGCLIFLLMLGLALLGNRPVLNQALQILKDHLAAAYGYELEVGNISGHLLGEFALGDIKLVRNGETLLSISSLNTGLRPISLLRGIIEFDYIDIQEPTLNRELFRTGGQEDGEDAAALPPFISALIVHDLDVTGGACDLPEENLTLTDVNISGALNLTDRHFSLSLAEGSASCPQAGSGPVKAQGEFTLESGSAAFSPLIISREEGRVSCRGRINWRNPEQSDLQLDILYGEPMGNGDQFHPWEMILNFTGAQEDFLIALDLRQNDASLRLEGGFNPQTGNYELKGRANNFLPGNLGLGLLSSLPMINMSGDVSLRGEPGKIVFSLRQIQTARKVFTEIEGDIAWRDNTYNINRLRLRDEQGYLDARGLVCYPFGQRESSLTLDIHNFTLPPGDENNMLREIAVSGQMEARGNIGKGELSLNLRPALPGEAEIILDALLEWQGRELNIKRGNFRAPGAEGALSGKVSLNEFDLNFDFDIREINYLYNILNLRNVPYLPSHGLLKGDGRLRGDWRRPELQLNAKAININGPDISLRSLDASLNIIWTERLEGKARLRGLSLGMVSAGQIDIDGNIRGQNGELAVRAAGLNRWRGSAALAPGSQQWDMWRLENTQLVNPQRQLWEQNGFASFSLRPENIALSGLHLTENLQNIKADFSRQRDRLEGKLTIENFELVQISGADTLPAHPLLNLTASLSGKPGLPLLDFRGDISALYSSQTVSVLLLGTAKNDRLEVEARVSMGGAVLMSFNLLLNPGLSDPFAAMQMDVRAKGVSLEPLQVFIPHMRELQGTVDIDAAIKADDSGRLQASGYLQLSGVDFSTSLLNRPFNDLNARLVCQGQDLVIEDFSLRSGSGLLSLRGSAGLPWIEQSLNLALLAQDFNLDLSPVGSLLLDSEFLLGGSYDLPVLKGTVTVKSAQGKIFQAGRNDLDDVVTLHSQQTPPAMDFGGDSADDFALPELLDSWQLEVDLVLAENFQINFPQGRIRSSGSASMNKAAYASPLFSGSYRIDSGIFIILGTRIEQVGGKIEFIDPQSMLPELDINASVRYDMVNINISITGPASSPQLSLRSDLPMSQADILSMLAFARPVQELDRRESNSLSNQALALAMIGQQGRQEMEYLFGSALTPDIITTHNETQGGPSIEAGKYLLDNVYLRYRQGIDENNFQNLGLEWRLTPRVTLQGQIGTMRDTGVDIFFHFVFGAAPSP
ncbi:MAG: translocation/assembly module TamB [Desulfarculales bacterium]|jgi:autotransporter translocation and assembly factor TamB|nr:translocation/assembly module TamB [Desulfarculales bacterium]